MKKKANKFVQVWVPIVKKSVSTATSNSTADRNNATVRNTTANKISTANPISTANEVSTANKISTTNPIINVNDVSTTNKVNPANQQKGKSIWHVDSGCSRHIIGNKSYLQNFKRIDGGHVAFGDNPSGGKISGKGIVSKGEMTFEDVYYVEQLRYNLLSVSQMHLGLFSEDKGRDTWTDQILYSQTDSTELCVQEKKDASDLKDTENAQNEVERGEKEDQLLTSEQLEPEMPALAKDDTNDENSSVFGGSSPEKNDSNLDVEINEEAIHQTKVHKDHPP
ncbi:hypothetical protein L6452_22085 [Arctium lappa]|uniref:Uncharacterized protein n=1 Tax=Arctium lappa TaxID=4217 RepID=A0ACB9AXY5_ARCLA|nr:hypothetical protein L6452_22085 [Arctium lappa]